MRWRTFAAVAASLLLGACSASVNEQRTYGGVARPIQPPPLVIIQPVVYVQGAPVGSRRVYRRRAYSQHCRCYPPRYPANGYNAPRAYRGANSAAYRYPHVPTDPVPSGRAINRLTDLPVTRDASDDGLGASSSPQFLPVTPTAPAVGVDAVPALPNVAVAPTLGPVSVKGLAGAYKLAGGNGCSVNLSSRNMLDLHRASTSGCKGSLGRVTSWRPTEAGFELLSAGGKSAGTFALDPAGGFVSRMDGRDVRLQKGE